VALFVGTSGWDYREWRGGFYPPDLPAARFLEHYGRTLDACEINATFYRLHSEETMRRWARMVPAAFRFAAKAHRQITHRRRFAPQEAGQRAFLDGFLATLAPLEDRLGCVLFQFPPVLERDDQALSALLAALPPGFSFACEFRHSSWNSAEVTALVAGRGGTVCLAETEGSVPDALPAGPLAYVRLRAECYTEKARAAWLALLEREAGGRDVYAFAKHEGVPAGDPFTGVGLAEWLTREADGGAADR
jgi:uncharacterized protein YecE (DUF72 family)